MRGREGNDNIKKRKGKKKTLPMQNVGQGGMWPRHPGVHVIVGVLILVIPVPISTSWGVVAVSFSSLAVAVHGAPGCPVVWPGLHPHRHFVAVSVLALPSTLRAVAQSSSGGCCISKIKDQLILLI